MMHRETMDGSFNVFGEKPYPSAINPIMQWPVTKCRLPR